MSSSGPLQERVAGSFIWQQDQGLTADQCRRIIEQFEADPNKHAGRAGSEAQEQPDLKRSTDLIIDGDAWKEVDGWLFASLSTALRELRQRVTYFRGGFKDQGYAVQRTGPGEFYHWHVDADSRELANRQLVAIWYLNTLEGEGGETEFLHQNIKVVPAAGRLILFPPFWTHTHRGVMVGTGTKYIATTWVVFA